LKYRDEIEKNRLPSFPKGAFTPKLMSTPARDAGVASIVANVTNEAPKIQPNRFIAAPSPTRGIECLRHVLHAACPLAHPRTGENLLRIR
jgi:hypothetical protein